MFFSLSIFAASTREVSIQRLSPTTSAIFSAYLVIVGTRLSPLL